MPSCVNEAYYTINIAAIMLALKFERTYFTISIITLKSSYFTMKMISFLRVSVVLIAVTAWHMAVTEDKGKL